MKNFRPYSLIFNCIVYFLYACSILKVLFTMFCLCTFRCLHFSIISIPISFYGFTFEEDPGMENLFLLTLPAVIVLWILIYVLAQCGKEHKFAKLCAVIAIALSYVVDFIASFSSSVLALCPRTPCKIVSLLGLAVCILAIIFYIKSNKEAKVFSLSHDTGDGSL